MLSCGAMRAPWLLALIFTLGCGGPSLADLETGSVSIVVSAVSTEPGVATAGEPQGGLVIERAFVSMSSLVLTPCRSDASELVLSPRGYELLSEPPNAELISTAVTELCGLRFDIDPLARNASEDVPEGASLYVAGTNAAGAPFEIVSEQSWSLELALDEPESFGREQALLGFDLSLWLAALPMDAGYEYLTVEAFEKQLRGAVALYRDANENGALDSDEQTPVATAAAAR